MANEATTFVEHTRTVFGNKYISFGTLTAFNGTGTQALELDVFSTFDAVFINCNDVNAIPPAGGVVVGETFPNVGSVTLTPVGPDGVYTVMSIGSL